MMRVLSGDTVAQAKLHVPRKQISPFENHRDVHFIHPELMHCFTR